ncbi:hypothetical protein NQZ79_g3080 [Umbelopsis isabellina]|nr:hypothetical protein NQZ79_g3080 [Umbelopsis isabellina]
MAATSVNSVSPYTPNDTDFSGSSASPEEHPLPSPLDEHDKRKFDQVESNGKSLATKHSHLDQDDIDDDDDVDRPRKPGRKPMANTPTPASVDPKLKRKAQNRAAQRAFRERKEKYVKELEDRIAELESSQEKPSVNLEKENQQLKELVQKLEAENYLLKGTAFTFDFPISKATNNKPNSALVPDAGVQPSTLLRNDGVVPSSNPDSAWTPPSSAHDDSGSEASSPSNSTAKTAETTPTSNSEKNTAPTSFASFGDLSANALDSTIFDNNAAFDTTAADRFMANQCPHLSNEELERSALFSQYRTPSSDIDNTIFSETPMPPLFETDFDNYGAFAAPILTPKEEGQFSASELLDLGYEAKPSFEQPGNHEDKMTPVQAWEWMQQHPNFDEIEIDDLCDQMKKKATCSGKFTKDELNDVIHNKIHK